MSVRRPRLWTRRGAPAAPSSLPHRREPKFEGLRQANHLGPPNPRAAGRDVAQDDLTDRRSIVEDAMRGPGTPGAAERALFGECREERFRPHKSGLWRRRLARDWLL